MLVMEKLPIIVDLGRQVAVTHGRVDSKNQKMPNPGLLAWEIKPISTLEDLDGSELNRQIMSKMNQEG